MKIINPDTFLEDLAWSDSVRLKLTQIVAEKIHFALSASRRDGRLIAAAWDEIPEEWDESVEYVTFTSPLYPAPRSKTGLAVQLVEQGVNRYVAAGRVGVAYASVHKAVKLRKERGVCSHCGQTMPKSGIER